jgi:hypothetical protein
VANIFGALARKLGMKDPPKPKPIPDLLTEGEFGPHEGQPVASLNVPTFDVMGLGLVDPAVKAAKERLVANTRKIIGEAKRAYRFAEALQSTMLVVEAQSFRTVPDQLPEEPDPIPRQVVLAAYDKKEREIELWKQQRPALLAAQAKAKQEQQMLIATRYGGSEAAYAASMRAHQDQAAALAKEKEKWTALAAAGDPAGKAWLEWQKVLQATTYAKTKWDSQSRYGSKSAAGVAEQIRLSEVYYAAKKLSDAWGKKFQELKNERQRWIEAQQIAQGTHPAQIRYAELVALRAASRTSPPTHHFTVAENVEQTKLFKQLRDLHGMTPEQIALLGAT